MQADLLLLLVAFVLIVGAIVAGGLSLGRRSSKRKRTTQTRHAILADYADATYFVQRLGREEGPYTTNQVSDLMARSEILVDTTMRRADGGNPFSAREFEHLTGARTLARLGGWAVAVFFFGWVGGLVGFLMLQDENRPRAKRVLMWGLIWTAIWLTIAVALIAVVVGA